MIISEEDKEKIKKLHDEGAISDKILTHLKRNYPITEVQIKTEEFEGKYKTIYVGSKMYFMDGNKKFLVSKLDSILEDVFPHIDESIRRRTIKNYLSVMMK